MLFAQENKFALRSHVEEQVEDREVGNKAMFLGEDLVVGSVVLSLEQVLKFRFYGNSLVGIVVGAFDEVRSQGVVDRYADEFGDKIHDVDIQVPHKRVSFVVYSGEVVGIELIERCAVVSRKHSPLVLFSPRSVVVDFDVAV